VRAHAPRRRPGEPPVADLGPLEAALRGVRARPVR
jgi:hypothetical protein